MFSDTENKKQIAVLRAELVDYTDTTPNEPRYISEGILDNRVFYPLGNKYIYDSKQFKNESVCEIPIYPIYSCRETNEINPVSFILMGCWAEIILKN